MPRCYYKTEKELIKLRKKYKGKYIFTTGKWNSNVRFNPKYVKENFKSQGILNWAKARLSEIYFYQSREGHDRHDIPLENYLDNNLEKLLKEPPFDALVMDAIASETDFKCNISKGGYGYSLQSTYLSASNAKKFPGYTCSIYEHKGKIVCMCGSTRTEVELSDPQAFEKAAKTAMTLIENKWIFGQLQKKFIKLPLEKSREIYKILTEN